MRYIDDMTGVLCGILRRLRLDSLLGSFSLELKAHCEIEKAF